MNKDEMKMIEEMATHMVDYCDRFQMCPYDADSNVTCDICKARSLYNANCRIIADDEMVIKKSEYDTLLRSYTLTYDNAYQWGLKVGEEKTAIEILQKLKDNIMFADFGCGDGYEEVVDMDTNELKKLAESYGIELED